MTDHLTANHVLRVPASRLKEASGFSIPIIRTRAWVMPCVACMGLLSSAALAEEQPPSTTWGAYAADSAATKYLPLKQINAGNVAKLQEKWVWASPDNALVDQFNASGQQLWPHAYESTPIMIDDRLYVSTSLSQVASIDAATGRTVWVHDPRSYLSEDSSTIVYPPNVGFVQRGVTYWDRGGIKRLFFATGSAVLIALDARTGQLEREFGDGGMVDLKQGLRRPAPQPYYGSTSPPLVCGNVVIVGSTVVDFPVERQMPPGDVRGFDARTGKLLWTFHTVPQDGERGAETWEPEGRRDTGGANVWAPMSCDSQLGIAYLPVSTPANDFYGGHRIGSNLFGESLVALHASTGKLVWHYQLVHHGLWDYDTPAAPNLVDIRVAGRAIKAVAQVTKQGFVFVFDRVTGKPVWPIVERPVPQSHVPGEQSAATQPFPSKPLPFDRQGMTENDLIDFTPALRRSALETITPFAYGPLFTPPVLDESASGGPRGLVSMPGNVGGASWAGAAVNPKTGVLYVPSVSMPWVITLSPSSPARYSGSAGTLRLPNGLPIVKPPYGRLTAIDLNSGDHLWMRPVGNGPVNHPAIRSLGLKDLGWDRRSFFIATDSLLFGVQEGVTTPRAEQLNPLTVLFDLKNDDAFLWALDPQNGKKLLELPIPYGNATGSPMTYEVQGKQFVVIPVGGSGHPSRLVAYSLP